MKDKVDYTIDDTDHINDPLMVNVTKSAFEVKKTPITRHFDTGAVRGEDTGRGKPSLLPFEAISMVSRCFGGAAFMPMIGVIHVSKVYEAGAQKYADRNWEKGIPFSAYVDSAMRHFEKFQRGETDEPHCAQVSWNLICLLQTYLWVADGKIGQSTPIIDIPLIDMDAAALRKEPLPRIRCDTLSLHANFAMGSLFGFCYGKHPINLAASVAHSLMLVDVYYGCLMGHYDQEFNDMPNVRT